MAAESDSSSNFLWWRCVPHCFWHCSKQPKGIWQPYTMLSSFHIAKVVEHCIGKIPARKWCGECSCWNRRVWCKSSRVYDDGSHYIRSLRRIIILADALSTLKWKAFWKTNDGADFGDILSVADQLKIVFKER